MPTLSKVPLQSVGKGEGSRLEAQQADVNEKPTTTMENRNPASPLKASPSVRSSVLADQSTSLRRNPKRNASMQASPSKPLERVWKSIEKAKRVCLSVINNLERIFADDFDVNGTEKVEKSIEAFFGTKPEDDEDWRHCLWSGNFFPILGFCSLYSVHVDWDKQYDKYCASDDKLSVSPG